MRRDNATDKRYNGGVGMNDKKPEATRRVFGLPRTVVIILLAVFYGIALAGLVTYILVGGDARPVEPSDFVPSFPSDWPTPSQPTT